MKLQEEEVESVHLWSVDEINRRIQENEKICPDSIVAYKEFLKFGLLD